MHGGSGEYTNWAVNSSRSLQTTKQGASSDAVSYVLRRIYVASAASAAVDVADARNGLGKDFVGIFWSKSQTRRKKLFVFSPDSSLPFPITTHNVKVNRMDLGNLGNSKSPLIPAY